MSQQQRPPQEQPYPGRTADPDEIAPSYVFFASNELSSYYTRDVLAPLGGETLHDGSAGPGRSLRELAPGQHRGGGAAHTRITTGRQAGCAY